MRKVLTNFCIFVLFFLAWELFLAASNFKYTLIPTPTRVILALGEIITDRALWENTFISFYRLAIGFVLGCIFALPLGLFIGFYKKINYFIKPLLFFIISLSPLAWLPLLILWLGFGDLAIIITIFITTFSTLLLLTIECFDKVNSNYFKLALNLKLNKLTFFKKIILPIVTQQILKNIKTIFLLSWFMLLGSEMISFSSGLGYYILLSKNYLRADTAISLIFYIGMLLICLNSSLLLLFKQIYKISALKMRFNYVYKS